jgi:tRNA(His) 5'-end guanylyltransferase
MTMAFMQLVHTFPQFAGKFKFDNPTEEEIKKAMNLIMRKMIKEG